MKCPKCDFENPDTTRFCGECGAELVPPEEISSSRTDTLEAAKKELTTGSTFAGRYQVIEELGRGGMGKVYKVLDKEIKEKVALKLLNPEVAADEKTINRFRNELKFARRVGHRNVCRMYDLSKEEGTYYITMEYVPGEDLKSMIRMMGQLSAGKTIYIAKQVCEGLVEAHRLGVVHRDLKPQNIMIDREGNARVMDFGIARSIKAKGVTETGMIIGTPEYMSPEQVEGKEADHRSDVYSLGVILYETVTGRVPFKGDTPLSIAVKHKSEMPRDPKELNAQIPLDLSRMILKCMEKDKEKRYQSTEEILSELIELEKSVPTTERIMPERKPITTKLSRVKWKSSLLYGGTAILLILLILGGFYLFTGRQKAIDSIAVLPLKNISGDPEQEYFADGMTEALIAELAKIGALRRVISSTSVMQYKGVHKRLAEIARELNVDAMVEGSVLLVGQEVRITAKLIEAKTDRSLWADTYERDMRDVLALQSELAKSIAQEIKIKLTAQEQMYLAKAIPVNPEAYRHYLKGRWFWNKRTEEGLKMAIEHFEKAIEKDPDYALAYAGLADSYLVLPYYSSFQPTEAFPKVKATASKALEIDNTLAEARAPLAFIKMIYDWDWEGAEKEFKQAIELNPGYATAHHWYALYFMFRARFDQAIAEMKRAQELDPLSLVINRNLGDLFYRARKYDQAEDQLQKTLEMDPNFSEAHQLLGLVYLQKSMYEEALEELQKEMELSKSWNPIVEAMIGITLIKMGKEDQAKQVLDKLIKESEQTYVSPYHIALVYFAFGENNKGFKWLEKAYEERDNYLCYNLKIDPVFDGIRTDQRYVLLLQKVGLEK